MRKLLVVLAVVVGGISTAHAQSINRLATVEDLREACRLVVDPDKAITEKDLFDAGQCMAYLQGVRYGVDATTKIHKTPPLFCPPERVSNGQLAEVFVKWANEHPAALNNTSTIGVINALHDAWPCS